MVLSNTSTNTNHHHCLGIPRLARRNKLNLTSVLKELKVPCKIKKPFFIENEDRLEYIYYDFEKAARKALAKAHPDIGGDTENFQNLNEHIQMVRRSFGRNGIGSKRFQFDKTKYDNTLFWQEYNQRWKVAMAIYSSLRYWMRKDGAL
jgi:hypothetical protein